MTLYCTQSVFDPVLPVIDVDEQLGNISDLTSSHMETRSRTINRTSNNNTAAPAPTPFDDPSPNTVDIHTIK